MGVPAFFRWLTRKYPSTVVECIEKSEVDYSEGNPNGIEFDNLYIDLNGVIHPCTHSEDRPFSQNEDEMMVAIFESIDRIFKIVRPRKLLYLAVDGVAPRAKMNQQRSRRFRVSKEVKEKAEQLRVIRRQLEEKGVELLPEVDNFDSNCITPGTEFMFRLTKCLNYYIHDRIANDVGWKRIKVIFSDANVPGEGEHKIMDFIRRQRAHEQHDPNTHHCICGADADLIMLSLASHEPHFTIIREEFVPNNTEICLNCREKGHVTVDCKGVSSGTASLCETEKTNSKKFIFIRLNVLREYLDKELYMDGFTFEYDLERAIDDWVFMCFFVGNDFLPHLPSLIIYEGAIDRLINLYKSTISRTNGYLTDNGNINLERLQIILYELGNMEDGIFKKRRYREIQFRQHKKNKLETQRMLLDNKDKEKEYESEPIDEIKLWVNGYKERYYKLKFNTVNDTQENHKIAREYIRGLCWVLKYYYQGCASWNWYYPYYYAPFASDFVNISYADTVFEKGNPFTPLEQLMAVFPPGSSSLVPCQWAHLMTNQSSPILDFYPNEFMIDFNGKRFAWQGVALLPFVDENRLKKALSLVYNDLTEAEIDRNKCGHIRLYMGIEADCFNYINNLDPIIYKKNKNSLISDGVYGDIYIISHEFFQGLTVQAPIKGVHSVETNSAICVAYSDPQYPTNYIFKSTKLAGVREPPKVLQTMKQPSLTQPNNLSLIYEQRYLGNNTRTSPLIGMVPFCQRASVSQSGHIMLGRTLNNAQRQNLQKTISRLVKNHNSNRFHPYINLPFKK